MGGFLPISQGLSHEGSVICRLILDGITLYLGYHMTLVISYIYLAVNVGSGLTSALSIIPTTKMICLQSLRL